MISPGQVSYSPIWRHRLYSGPTSEICGNIATPSATSRISCLPGKFSRAIAYAADEAMATARTVEISPIPIELRSASVKMPCLKISE
jgi:hypothetical protein